MHLIVKGDKEISQYTLISEDKEIASFRYNRSSHTIRVHASQKRQFFLSRSTAFLQQKIVLQTEYGLEIGENFYINNRKKGILHLSGHKFFYQIHPGGLDISDKRKQLLGRFNFETSGIDNYEMTAILFTLAWMCEEKIIAVTAHKVSGLYAS
jgi:hypothetical protein